LMVTSQTYAQSSAHNAEAAASDAGNRWLWRMNRTRLDAECVRDAALAITGQLDLTMGGPSERHFKLSPGVHVTPVVDYSALDLDLGKFRRRSIYRFLFRTLPDPFMDALDCPDASQITPVRTESVTALQALAVWNDRFMLRQAENLASRLEGECSDAESRVTLACELMWNRTPSRGESADLREYALKYGWSNLCRLLFNLNEFVFVN